MKNWFHNAIIPELLNFWYFIFVLYYSKSPLYKVPIVIIKKINSKCFDNLVSGQFEI